MSDPIDLDLARQSRQDRRDIALLELFSSVLRMPLERRELTPEQEALREERLRERHVRRMAARSVEVGRARVDFP